MIKKRIILVLTAILIFANMPIAVYAANYADIQQAVQSETAILIDADTGQILFEKNMHRQMYPASITKIMTALLALENAELSDIITMSYDAVFSVGRDTSHIALDVDEQLTLEQALHALALQSANDAANGIAEHIGGSMDGFADMMNDRAALAGALNTNFVNAHGLSDDNHVTTAHDMAQITMAAFSTPHFAEIFGATYYEMPPTNKQPETRYFHCTNAMVMGRYSYDGVIAEKTGWTSASQNTLVTIAQRDGRTLIVVVMKSQAAKIKWEDTTALLDYGFDNFTQISYLPGELAQDNFTLTNGSNVALEVDTSPSFLLDKSLSKSDVEIQYVADGIGGVKAVFAINSALTGTMYGTLGEIEMQTISSAIADTTVPTSEAVTESGGTSIDNPRSGMPVIVKWLVGIVAVVALLFILLVIRRNIIVSRRRRRRRTMSNSKQERYRNR